MFDRDQRAETPVDTPTSPCVHITWTQRRGRVLRRPRTFVELRDSKLGNASPVELFSLHEWHEFCETASTRLSAPGGGYRIGDLYFTKAQWATFCDMIRVGEHTRRLAASERRKEVR